MDGLLHRRVLEELRRIELLFRKLGAGRLGFTKLESNAPAFQRRAIIAQADRPFPRVASRLERRKASRER